MNSLRWAYEEKERNLEDELLTAVNPFKVGDHVICVKRSPGVIDCKKGVTFEIQSTNKDHISGDAVEYYHYSFFELDIVWYRKQKLLKLQKLQSL